jgi:hypothetical protein
MNKDKPEVSEQTKAIYKSKKMVYNRVRHNLDKLNPAQRKHFEDVALFIKNLTNRVEYAILKCRKGEKQWTSQLR